MEDKLKELNDLRILIEAVEQNPEYFEIRYDPFEIVKINEITDNSEDSKFKKTKLNELAGIRGLLEVARRRLENFEIGDNPFEKEKVDEVIDNLIDTRASLDVLIKEYDK